MRCRACGRDLPLSAFCVSSEFISEILTVCRECYDAGRTPKPIPSGVFEEIARLYEELDRKKPPPAMEKSEAASERPQRDADRSPGIIDPDEEPI